MQRGKNPPARMATIRIGVSADSHAEAAMTNSAMTTSDNALFAVGLGAHGRGSVIDAAIDRREPGKQFRAVGAPVWVAVVGHAFGGNRRRCLGGHIFRRRLRICGCLE